MFQKLFELVAKSDSGVLGGMSSRRHCVSLREFVSFMKSNSYQRMGLTINDLTDAFKFANSATGARKGTKVSESEADSGAASLHFGADADKSEMSEEEFWQCLMFVQARYAALQSDPHVPVPSTRAAFDYNHSGVQQLGNFMQELCGKSIVVRLEHNRSEILNLRRNAPKPTSDSEPAPLKMSRLTRSSTRDRVGGKGGALVDDSAPLTQIEKARV
jgi:hypothetical protein